MHAQISEKTCVNFYLRLTESYCDNLREENQALNLNAKSPESAVNQVFSEGRKKIVRQTDR